MTLKKVIILNKPFIGSWNGISGNIPHEIIDFMLTDDGQYYAYNNPRGVCPDWIKVGISSMKKPSAKKETHEAKYLLLTGKWTKKTGKVEILYCIELEEKVHSLHTSTNPKNFEDNQNEVKKEISARNIKYNGKLLYDIYGTPDDTLYVTFKAKKILQPKNSMIVSLDYSYQRNKGYIKSDENPSDYEKLTKSINETCLWNKLNLPSLKKGFADLDKFVKDQGNDNLTEAAKRFGEACKKV